MADKDLEDINRLNETPLDKARNLLDLAGVAGSLGDFRLAAKLYADAKKWIRYGESTIHWMHYGELTSRSSPSQE